MFKNKYIEIGGLPKAWYYNNDFKLASVKIDNVLGTNDDFIEADKKLREVLGDPNWKRPKKYSWNHAGEPGSTVMELVLKNEHLAVAHKGPASIPGVQAGH